MPRTFRHWTPRYVANRVALALYERRYPAAPWITREACAFLQRWLKPHHVGLEWGSGRSTLWFAERVGRLTSIEHDAQWHRRVSAQLDARGFTTTEYYLASLEPTAGGAAAEYVELGRGPSETLDFALVDGKLRDLCTQVALPRIRPGGLLVIDNAEQFLPHATHSPASFQRTGRPRSPLWMELEKALAGWERRWTSNGVCDTAIFIKPLR